jgi:hypothetical protein
MKIVKSSIKISDHKSAVKFVNFLESQELSINETISRIVKLSSGLNKFWSQAKGWAPLEAANLLSKSRLDWQLSLSYCLKYWINEKTSDEEQGSLILGWANLGSLVEGAMKIFLSVWYNDYKKDVSAIKMKDKIIDPDGLQMEPLRQFFFKKIWDKDWDAWVRHIQQRRNTIHAFKSKDIGTREEFLEDLRKYLDLLRYINFRLPYPDEMYIPRET